jgi:hypothetical protein
METQQILEILAKLNAKMDANQAEMKTDRKANQARMVASMKFNEDLLVEFKGF